MSRSQQLTLDFGDRFDEVAYKETDRAVISILKGCAILGLGQEVVNKIMTLIGSENEAVRAHIEKD